MPSVYAPRLAMTFINLSHLFQKTSPKRDKSINYLEEALILLRPIIKTVPYIKDFIQEIKNILKDWDLNNDEINHMIEGKRKNDEQI
jgi:hypothetical protein